MSIYKALSSRRLIYISFSTKSDQLNVSIRNKLSRRANYNYNRHRSFLVANAQQGLCHIIYCSDGFCRLTGFSRAEVMQRPAVCEFLHGPMTSPHAVAALRDALAAGVEKHFEILYYRKDVI
ncbi:potassium voltage-gated channel subfamily H member 6-like [Vespula squamosa]|uniref:Potassium voltage-gated channel subfamily H member 6-like n=1 Tax=Vespula squamosa TaxID=30214 RepID=A0ABD2C6V5_VESSQ